jgi:argininosuccinate lyase
VVALGAEVTRTLAVDRDALAAAAGAHFTGAADLAEELVLRNGLDYRSAYRVVGRAVAAAVDTGRSSLAADDLARAAAELLGRPLTVDPETLRKALDPALIVAGRTVLGGSAPERVREHCRSLKRSYAEGSQWRDARRDHTRQAEDRLVAAAHALAGSS